MSLCPLRPAHWVFFRLCWSVAVRWLGSFRSSGFLSVNCSTIVVAQVTSYTSLVDLTIQCFLLQLWAILSSLVVQKPASMADAHDFFKPLTDMIAKATAMTEHRKPDYFNHLKSVADSLPTLVGSLLCSGCFRLIICEIGCYCKF